MWVRKPHTIDILEMVGLVDITTKGGPDETITVSSLKHSMGCQFEFERNYAHVIFFEQASSDETSLPKTSERFLQESIPSLILVLSHVENPSKNLTCTMESGHDQSTSFVHLDLTHHYQRRIQAKISGDTCIPYPYIL